MLICKQGRTEKMTTAEILKGFLGQNRGRRSFPEYLVKGLLRGFGLPVPDGIFISREDFTHAIPMPPLPLKYPLVAKISSQDISSKTDVHGVLTGLNNEGDLRNSVRDLLQIKQAEGVLVEEMAPQGVEVIVGGTIDRQFGPVIMFGLGGVFVELFRDVAFGLAPVTGQQAASLIRQVKGYRLLEGYRGSRPVDVNALASVIVTVSDLIATGLITEIDLNPVAVYPSGAMVLDAKMSVQAG